MFRMVFSYVLPLVLPTILYFVWMSWVRRKVEAARRRGEDAEHMQLKTPWIRLLLAGVMLMAVGLAVLATVSGAPPSATYQSPRFEDGKIKPAEMIPNR
ncbi:MAG: hypothetical protein KAI73_06350 [Rhodospirillaceae bacterium]|nr:hypothetical protein [Rhodospirillaceae bacterium]